MKRASSEHADGSLELLLDTICNTFGGIIFISLLLLILINTTSEKVQSQDSSDTPATAELMDAETRRESRSNELARLRHAESLQVDVVGSLAENVAAARRLQEAEARHVRQVQAKSAAVGDASRAQIKNNEHAAQAAARKEQLEQAKRKAEELRKQLAKSISKRSSGATAAKVRRNVRSVPVAYFVQRGKLYGPLLLNGQRNTTDFKFTSVEDTFYIDPIPERGLAITEDGSNLAAIRRKLSAAKPGWNSVELLIWEDSFRQFEPIRLALEEHNLPYEIRPWEPNDRLVFSDDKRERWEQQ